MCKIKRTMFSIGQQIYCFEYGCRVCQIKQCNLKTKTIIKKFAYPFKRGLGVESRHDNYITLKNHVGFVVVFDDKLIIMHNHIEEFHVDDFEFIESECYIFPQRTDRLRVLVNDIKT